MILKCSISKAKCNSECLCCKKKQEKAGLGHTNLPSSDNCSLVLRELGVGLSVSPGSRVCHKYFLFYKGNSCQEVAEPRRGGCRLSCGTRHFLHGAQLVQVAVLISLHTHPSTNETCCACFSSRHHLCLRLGSSSV